LFGYSRQAYYKHQLQQLLQIRNQQHIIQQVLRIRKHQPRCGGRKLLVMLQPFLQHQNIRMGRLLFQVDNYEIPAQQQAIKRWLKYTPPPKKF